MPFGSDQAKAHYIVVALAIEMLVTQDAFLAEAQLVVKANRALIVSQRLATELVQPYLGKSVIQCCPPQRPPGSSRCIRCQVKTPVGNTTSSDPVKVDEALRHPSRLEHQQMTIRILRRLLEPAPMFIFGNFMLGIHVATHIGVISPGQYTCKVSRNHRSDVSKICIHLIAPDVE